jgi:predicted ATP-grasp superfamily ATP-dependent carboligase
MSAARLSRFARSYWAFDGTATEADFLGGLRFWAAQASGHVLLPASDETAWLFAKHAEELGRHYTVYAPRIDVIDTIIDKQRLWHACKSIGVATLPSWFPESLADVSRLASELDFPVLIKPRQHLFRRRREKGTVVGSAKDLESAFETFVEREHGGDKCAGGTAQPLPIIQTFVETAVENVLSVTGFIDRSGTRTITNATRKILQRSRPAGVGLAFESIALPDGLGEDALRLCRHIGAFGIFEIEFVWHDGAWRVIDFNPRFYQEMRLDIARGIPLPLLAYLDASGDLAGLDAVLAAARTEARTTLGFSDMFTTTLMMALRLAVNFPTARGAVAWHWRNRRGLVDATFDWRDPLPFLGHAVCELRVGLEQFSRVVFEARLPRAPGQAQLPGELLE